jgi:hypothetical protein
MWDARVLSRVAVSCIWAASDPPRAPQPFEAADGRRGRERPGSGGGGGPAARVGLQIGLIPPSPTLRSLGLHDAGRALDGGPGPIVVGHRSRVRVRSREGIADLPRRPRRRRSGGPGGFRSGGCFPGGAPAIARLYRVCHRERHALRRRPGLSACHPHPRPHRPGLARELRLLGRRTTCRDPTRAFPRRGPGDRPGGDPLVV